MTANYRETRTLNGPWEFVTDPASNGRAAGWDAPDATWPDRRCTVDVPHSWQERDEYREYTGSAWYRRYTALPRSDGDRTILRFGAVDYEATVWVNGERVGEHRGGYLPFELDITEAVTDGEDAVVVAVTDPEDISEIPHGKQGAPWYQRVSGIWQDVTVATVPKQHVTDVRATPNLEDDMVRIDLEAAPESATGLTAAVTIERDGESVARSNVDVDAGAGTAVLAIDDPEYWTPETPALYDIVVELSRDGVVVDRYEDYFGMRSVESRDGRLYLNGEPFYMRGALDQGYYPETLYRPFDDELFEAEIRTAKELGFNLLRKHIKPAHPDFLELADRLGILVWEEPANPTVHTDRSRREVREQIKGMIDRDYNRPSVIIWSLYNEEWGIGNPQGLDDETSLWVDEAKQRYLAELYESTRKRDPTRLICDNSGWAHVATDVNDYHRYFVSPDRAAVWADDLESMASDPAANYGATETDPADAPRIVSEFGTWGMCDLSAIEEYYGGEPPWFDYEFFDDPIKRPAGASDRFEESALSDAFEDWSAMAEAWQRREFRSIKDVIERMRTREDVAGYVLTEFSDIEWEFNGVLDYRREEKAFHDDFARINDAVLVSVEPDAHAVSSGGRLTADVVVSNDTTDAVEGSLEWSVFGESGTVDVALDGFGVERVENAITVDVPSVDAVHEDELTVSLPSAPTNGEPITVVPDPDSSVDGETTVYTDAEGLADGLAETGFEIVSSLDETVDVSLVVRPDAAVRAYVEGGGTAVLIPDESGHMADEEFFEYRSLPEDESWNLVASLFYCADETLSEYVGTVPGWELEGLYPYDVVADVSAEDVSIGYVEGWIANRSAAIAVREVGDGRVGAFTFRITDAYGAQPVGTAALAALLENLASEECS
ncbi:beta-galactosidase (plasmid) [Haloterrigena salifodinae]|uniref:Beta-galactosidase n=1 Tax=Haloterrigena salifodinae TaxID=2675099 RepID=A0A8T8E8Y9_9EURY|nr:sugar-binding domain-containing protein [Haloterrigena salifodinae]QRV17916.1 beta-galactosidase [Haloterrigena salifodinae]